MKKNSAVGICGKKEMNKVLFKNILIDVISRHYFGDVKLFLLIDDVQEYSWVKRIPHIYAANGMRNIVFDSESRNNVFEYLYKELTIRRSMKSCAGLPYLVVLVMNEWGIKTHPVSQFIENAKDIGVSFVFWGESKEEIPLYCGSIISIKDNNKGELIDSHKGEEKIEFSFDSISDLEMEKISQILEPIYCEEISLESSLRKSISLFELLGIYSVDDIDLIQNWNEARVWDTMAAPIGVNSKNEIVSLNLHEKFHGPHGLVAGTTGSGKSEILQTYILSAAILFHPYEVSFVIIDFKGGGMVNQFKDLPHLIGAITNIDGREINRSLKSIKAELLKRQSLFAEANVNHIDKYIQLYKNGKVKIPLPHLIIIVDEFAELKAEQPEFMKELISAARIGRSLGVHLILATQKPSGQVNEQIWSNSKFRLCLKVQNKEDSNEVLKSPLAAEIKEPGRAYLQVGNNEIFELLQSGFSGALEKANTSKEKSYIISQVDISGRKRIVYAKKKANSSKSSRTQLEAIVDYVRDTCIENGIERLQNICLPPLPSIVNIVETNKGNGMVSIGIYDDPDSQYQGDAFINISNENYMIIGSSGTGKTNFLQVIIRQIVNCYSPKQANIYIMDFGAMYLKNFQDLCYVGGVVTISEEEKLKKHNNVYQKGKSQITYAKLLAGLGKNDKALNVLRKAEESLKNHAIRGNILWIDEADILMDQGIHDDYVWDLLQKSEFTAVIPYDKLAIIIVKLAWCYENDQFAKANLLIERGQNLIPLEPDHHIHALFYYNAYAVLNKSGETERSQIYYKKAYALKEHSRYIKARIDEPKTKEEKNRIKHPWYIIYLSFWNHDIENISEYRLWCALLLSETNFNSIYL